MEIDGYVIRAVKCNLCQTGFMVTGRTSPATVHFYGEEHATKHKALARLVRQRDEDIAKVALALRSLAMAESLEIKRSKVAAAFSAHQTAPVARVANSVHRP
eukprot:8383449-Pyramimonas_sp.AAC.4